MFACCCCSLTPQDGSQVMHKDSSAEVISSQVPTLSPVPSPDKANANANWNEDTRNSTTHVYPGPDGKSDETSSQGTVQMTIENRFQVLRPIGQGSFGTVYHGRDICNERYVAVKILKQKGHQSVFRETKCLKYLGAVNCIPEMIWKGRTCGKFFFIVQRLGCDLFAAKKDRSPRVCCDSDYDSYYYRRAELSGRTAAGKSDEQKGMKCEHELVDFDLFKQRKVHTREEKPKDKPMTEKRDGNDCDACSVSMINILRLRRLVHVSKLNILDFTDPRTLTVKLNKCRGWCRRL